MMAVTRDFVYEEMLTSYTHTHTHIFINSLLKQCQLRFFEYPIILSHANKYMLCVHRVLKIGEFEEN